MKAKTSFALLLAAATCAASAAVTDPVGFVSLGDASNPGVNPAVAAFSETTFSLPLHNPIDFTGTVASSTATTVTLNEALVDMAFNAPSPGTPWVLEVASGTDEGLFLPIVSNDTTTITVAAGGGDDLSNLVAADVVNVRQAWTLGTLFASAAIPDGAVVSAYDIGQTGINNSANPTYVYASGFGGWLDGGTFALANDVILYPGESFVLVNNTATAIPSLTVAGEVPLSNSRFRIAKDGAGAQDTRFSYVTATEEILDNAGLMPVDGDTILYYDSTAVGLNKSPSTVIYASGFGGWLDGGTFLPVGASFTLDAGQGYVYRRDASAPIGDQVIQDEQDYIPSL